MGTARVQRQVSSSLNEKQLEAWFQDKLEEMADDDGGRGAYCGNWNANRGLCITDKAFATANEAEVYLERELEKNGEVLAVRIGDFNQAWPATKEQKTLMQRLEELRAEELEFEYRILERAKKQKSKTKKCPHCESSINVSKLDLPEKEELGANNRWPDMASCRRMGRVLFVHMIGLTDCPVCRMNLLKTDTDNKNYESLKKRLGELSSKVSNAKAEFDKCSAGKPKPYWLLAADCGE